MASDVDSSPPRPPAKHWLAASALATLTATSLVTFTLLYFTFTCRGLVQAGEWACPVATGLLCLLSIGSLVVVSRSDPGVLHRGSREQDPEARYTARVSRRLFQMPWCPTCRFHRLPRTLHCEICGICVEEFDHHSRWLNNCVGHRNIRLYLVLLGSLTLYLGAVLATCVFSITRRRQMPPLDRAMTILVAVPSGALLLPLILQLVTKAVAVSTARRPYEVQEDNPYDQGCTRNCFIEMCAPLGPKYMSEAVCLQMEQGTTWEPKEVTSPAQHRRDLPRPRSPTQGPPRSGKSSPLQEVRSVGSPKEVTSPAQHRRDLPGPRSPTQGPPRSGKSSPSQEVRSVGSPKEVTSPAQHRRDLPGPRSPTQGPPRSGKCSPLQEDFSSVDSKLDTANGIFMEGYLFKRASNAFKTWKRRWFSIKNNQLVYQKKFKDNPKVVLEDLRLCVAKCCEDKKRQFCFKVVSPTKSCMLQADSEKQRQAWIKAVETSIETAFRENGDGSELHKKSSPSTGSLGFGNESEEKLLTGGSALERVQSIPGNASCCDCGLADPEWASINLGITLCIECSGIHRGLGVEISKVRSLTLDTWKPEVLKLMCELGNDVINRVYEANVEKMGIKKPQPGQRQEKEAYIRAKYVERKFVDKYSASPSPPEQDKEIISQDCEERRLSISKPGPGDQVRASAQSSEGERQDSSVFLDSKHLNPGLQLYRASYEQNIPKMVEAFAHGADVNWANSEENKATPLIQAVLGGSLMTCEFLLQNGANVNQRDAQGRGPLHHATVLGHTGQVHLLLKRGANQHATDEEGKDPLSIAVGAANADIVTL